MEMCIYQSCTSACVAINMLHIWHIINLSKLPIDHSAYLYTDGWLITVIILTFRDIYLYIRSY